MQHFHQKRDKEFLELDFPVPHFLVLYFLVLYFLEMLDFQDLHDQLK
mgnify:CR=1 FL=1